MGFTSGSVSYRCFSAVTTLDSISQDVLHDMLAMSLPEAGAADETAYGWCGGEHVLDREFSFEHNVFGPLLHFGLQIDTNRVPGAIKRARILQEEGIAARGNPSGFISKAQRHDVRSQIKQQFEEEIKAGKYRRSKMLPVLWDLSTRCVYSPATGDAAGRLADLFERTFKAELVPQTPGVIATAWETLGDLRPTKFMPGPEGDGQVAEYPWAHRYGNRLDFLGSEFLLWLCHRSIDGNSRDKMADVVVEKSIELDCAYGMTGRDVIRGDNPLHMPETREAFRAGKVPRRLTLLMCSEGEEFRFSLTDSLQVISARLPAIEEAATPRDYQEERFKHLLSLDAAIEDLFTGFLNIRRSESTWLPEIRAMRRALVPGQQPATSNQ